MSVFQILLGSVLGIVMAAFVLLQIWCVFLENLPQKTGRLQMELFRKLTGPRGSPTLVIRQTVLMNAESQGQSDNG